MCFIWKWFRVTNVNKSESSWSFVQFLLSFVEISQSSNSCNIELLNLIFWHFKSLGHDKDSLYLHWVDYYQNCFLSYLVDWFSESFNQHLDLLCSHSVNIESVNHFHMTNFTPLLFNESVLESVNHLLALIHFSCLNHWIVWSWLRSATLVISGSRFESVKIHFSCFQWIGLSG